MRESYTSEKGESTQNPERKALGRSRGMRNGVCRKKPTSPSPLLLPQEMVAAQSPDGDQGAM